MKRAVFDQRDDSVGMPLDKRRPCMSCSKPTLIGTLSQYGARCKGCYDDYCAAKLPTPPTTGNKLTGGPKDLAKALRQREEAGERLSPVQKTMWRSALGVHG